MRRVPSTRMEGARVGFRRPARAEEQGRCGVVVRSRLVDQLPGT
ncbi:MAG TPA: hypothetical protein VFM14_11640 [Gemmatimonadales bacterium]|nr:hypothetical protein [Gemmatimonadales bacterium]